MDDNPLNEPPLAKAKRLYEERIGFKIKPDQDFYIRIGINRKRFGLMMVGRKEPTLSELKRIADVFQVSVAELL